MLLLIVPSRRVRVLRAVGIGNRIGIFRAVLLVAAGAAGGGAALAVASVPDGNGTYHACVQMTRAASGATVPDTSTTNLTVIDPSAGQHCIPPDNPVPNQSEISWNAAGPAGAPGPQGPPGGNGSPGGSGAPGQSVTVAAGHTLTIPGGQVITVGGTPGLTIAPPPLRSNAAPVGSLRIGSGAGALTFNLLDVEFAKTSTRAPIRDITITKKVDKSSPKLFQACATGKHFAKVTLSLRKAGGSGGGTGKIYLVFHFKLVAVKTIYTSPSSGAGSPLETLTLSFSSSSLSRG
jgi:hypothetical protein